MFVMIGVTCHSLASAQCPEIKIAYSAIWAPVTYDLQAKKKLGLGLDIEAEAFKRLRQKISFHTGMPWGRQLLMLEEGKIDAVAAMHRNPEREKTFAYSDPYHLSAVHVFTKKGGKLSFRTLDDLVGFKGLVTSATSYGEIFDQFAKNNLDVTHFREPDRLVELLLSGRFDYLILSEETGRFFIRKHQAEAKIEMTGPAVATNSIHLAMSKKSACQSLLPKFNETLAEMKEDGTVDRLVARNLEMAFDD